MMRRARKQKQARFFAHQRTAEHVGLGLAQSTFPNPDTAAGATIPIAIVFERQKRIRPKRLKPKVA